MIKTKIEKKTDSFGFPKKKKKKREKRQKCEGERERVCSINKTPLYRRRAPLKRDSNREREFVCVCVCVCVCEG